MKPILIVGYSGHAYIVIEICNRLKRVIKGYVELHEKAHNPYSLTYLGNDDDVIASGHITDCDVFVAIGDNELRNAISQRWLQAGASLASLVDPYAHVSSTAVMGKGTLVAAGAVIQAQTSVGTGVICNTSSIVEHDCIIDEFAHIAPGAVILGGVTVGANSLIGANAVVKQNVNIGRGCIVGAGAVVLKNVPDNSTVIGNPGQIVEKP